MVTIKKINRFALVSIYNKKNIALLCKIFKENNIGIISTGSTFKKIKSLGVDGFEVSKLDFTSKVLFKEWKLGPEEPELTVMRVTLKGLNENGEREQL